MPIPTERAEAPETLDPARKGAGRLHGRWLTLARVVWVAVALLAVVEFALSIPAFLAVLQGTCRGTAAFCSLVYMYTNQLSPENARALANLHVSVATYASCLLILDLASSSVFLVVGALIFWRRSDERLALFVSLVLIIYGVLGPNSNERSSALQLIYPPNSPAVLLQVLLQDVFSPALGIFFLLFPTGRFVPRWSWIFIFLWVIQAVTYVSPPDSPLFIGNLPQFVSLAVWLSTYGTALGCQIYRYARSSSPAQCQQTKWLVFGFASSFLLASGARAITLIAFPQAASNPDLIFILVKTGVGYLVLLPIPLAIGIAMLRYRLWDIDAIINKALVYGLLTALLATVYAGFIIGLEGLTGVITSGQTAQNPATVVISTLAIAALFRPLRTRIQNLTDRRFYRRKYDAEKALAIFSATLRDDVDLEQVRGHLLAVVQETMQLTHVSLWLLPEQRAGPLQVPKQPWRAAVQTSAAYPASVEGVADVAEPADNP